MSDSGCRIADTILLLSAICHPPSVIRPYREVILGQTLSSAEEGAPGEFSLEQNYPNPFNPTTAIHYALKERVHVTLKIYNILGQEVATLVDARQGVGVHSVVWNGRTKAGAVVPSGTYFYRITAGDFVAVRQMILLK